MIPAASAKASGGKSCFAVNQHHALQHAMLAHQIFRWTNLDFLFLTLLLVLRATQQCRSGQSCAAENNSAPDKNSAIRNALVLMSILHVLIAFT
jgi:hypothetical protein